MIEQGFTTTITKSGIKQLPLYKKALDLYALSRKLIENNSTQSLRQLYCSSSEQERLLEDMTVLALRLPFEVALAQTSSNYKTKVLSSKKVHKHTVTLKNHCKRLKEIRATNQEHLSLLYKEIQTFRKMQKQWDLLLTQQN
jgi:hypothetical protein